MASYDDFLKLNLRIAEVVDVKEHPNADRLYLLTISLGEETRQIVAGVRHSYTKEELKGKKVVVIENLDPAVIRGEESRGMMLAASSPDGPIILVPEKDAPTGTQVK